MESDWKQLYRETTRFIRENWQNPPLMFAAGIAIAIGVYFGYQSYAHTKWDWPFDDEVHVHADFAIYINGTRLDLSDDQYQTTSVQVLSTDIHIHDHNDHILHRHSEDATFAQLLESLEIKLTNTCLTINNGNEYCEDDSHILELYVNKVPTPDKTGYIPEESDHILLYYGTVSNTLIYKDLQSVTNESCIYSGTCPERGRIPEESCGRTCAWH